MNDKTFDLLVVGQGLSGSVLSDLLLKDKKKIAVIDEGSLNTSSGVAAGIFNPVTGRRIVKSWMADALIPFAINYYRNLENELEELFFYEMNLLEILYTSKEINEWDSRMEEQEMKNYLAENVSESNYRNCLQDFKKLIRINNSGWMNINKFLEAFRNKLHALGCLIEERFDHNKLLIQNDFITYKNITSKGIVFCEGAETLGNPLWSWLPLVPAKGEILTFECVGLPEDFILMSGIFILPIGNNLFRAGATFEWKYENNSPSENGREMLVEKLTQVLRIPFTITDHRAGIRPTVKDRRPLLGKHYKYDNVFIFNGLGTKGVQLAPYFANQFADFLKGGLLNAEADVKRWYKLVHNK